MPLCRRDFSFAMSMAVVSILMPLCRRDFSIAMSMPIVFALTPLGERFSNFGKHNYILFLCTRERSCLNTQRPSCSTLFNEKRKSFGFHIFACGSENFEELSMLFIDYRLGHDFISCIFGKGSAVSLKQWKGKNI